MKYLFFLTSSLVFVTPALADEAASEDNTNPTITVLGIGVDQPVDTAGQPVSAIGREEIASIQGPDLTRVLERLPGVAIIRNGGLGGQTSVFVRGANSYQTLVLVDGIRTADPSAPQGGYDFGNLLAGDVEKVELLRGSNSVVWGSQAIGGVLAVTTRQLNGVDASVEYGSRDTLNANVAAGTTIGPVSGTISAGYTRTDGISVLRAGTENDPFKQWNLTGKLRFDLGSGFALLAQARHVKSDLSLDFSTNDTALSAQDTQVARETSGRVGFEYRSDALELDGGYSLLRTHRVYDNPVFGGFEYRGRSERIELKGRWNVLPELAVVFGGDNEWSRYEGTFDPRQTARLASGHALLDFHSGAFRLSGGLRYDDHDRFGHAWTVGANGSVDLGDGWRVRASYGEGFRVPTLYELYGFAGNPLLKPETSKSYDLGIEKGTRGGDLHFGLTVFRRDSRNLIEYLNPFGPYFNTGQARAQGFELEGDAKLDDRFTVRATYAYTETKNLTAGDPLFGKELARRPRHLVYLGADWRSPFHDLTLGADLRFASEAFDMPDNVVRNKGYAVLTLRASLPVTEQIELFGRIENVTDEQYDTAAGYGTFGRSAYAGVRARF